MDVEGNIDVGLCFWRKMKRKAAKSAVKKFTYYPSESCVANKSRLGNAQPKARQLGPGS
jgi:hypothetical protein